MTMKKGKNDRLIAAAVMLVAGGVLAASGVMAFVELTRHNPSLSRYFLGYTLVVSGNEIIGQLRNSKARSDTTT